MTIERFDGAELFNIRNWFCPDNLPIGSEWWCIRIETNRILHIKVKEMTWKTKPRCLDFLAIDVDCNEEIELNEITTLMFDNHKEAKRYLAHKNP